MKNFQRTILSVIGIIACVGCRASIGREDLIGIYRADSGSYPDVIDVRGDGSYVHTYHLKPQGLEITTTNKWVCETNRGVTRITFESFIWGVDFVLPNSNEKQREEPSFWDVEVAKSFGRLRLKINTDVRQSYVKITSGSGTH